ncbi:MAG: FMN-binding protein [Leptospirales bacterium]|nr:FMN-binding protein [Leptospirales bacterium]
MRFHFSIACAILIPFALVLSGLLSQTTETAERIMQAQFPGSLIQKQTLYLSKESAQKLSAELGETVPRLQTYYLARGKAGNAGFGTFDTHVVRTKQETLFIVMDNRGTIKYVEVAAFLEPRDYLAPERWLRLFQGKGTGDQLDQPTITGATLTVKAVKNSIRRTLALQKLHSAELRK